MANHRRPPDTLIRKLFGREGVPWTEVQLERSAREMVVHTQDELRATQQQEKNSKLTSWKRRINGPILKHLGRWIRIKENGSPGVVVVGNEGPLIHRSDVAEAICDFWQQVWREPVPAATQSAAQLVTDFTRSGPDPQSFQWAPLCCEDLWLSVRQASGSGAQINGVVKK